MRNVAWFLNKFSKYGDKNKPFTLVRARELKFQKKKVDNEFETNEHKKEVYTQSALK